MDGGELKRRFGRKVHGLREAKGLTQDQLASRIGRSIDTLSNVERGVSSTRIETAYQLAQALEVRLADLFDIEDEASPVESERRAIHANITRQIRGQDLDTLLRLQDLINVGLALAQSSQKPSARAERK